MGMIKSAILVLLLACTSFAAEATINGPAEAKPGDLVVISGKMSKGAAFKWVMPDGIQTLSCSDLEFGFAVGDPGVYTFTLIAADTTDAENPIDIATHVVKIGTPVDPIPDPGPDKPTPPPAGYESLRILSKELSTSLGDPQTSQALASAIQSQADIITSMCQRGQCPSLDGAKRLMVQTIESQLLARSGSSRNIDWMKWREPINKALKESDTSTVDKYVLAMRAVAVGLR